MNLIKFETPTGSILVPADKIKVVTAIYYRKNMVRIFLDQDWHYEVNGTIDEIAKTISASQNQSDNTKCSLSQERLAKAIKLIKRGLEIDGAHHKQEFLAESLELLEPQEE